MDSEVYYVVQVMRKWESLQVLSISLSAEAAAPGCIGFLPVFNNSWGWGAAAQFFGLTYKAAETIFGYGPRSPREEAELIRQVVRDGGG